MGEPTHDYFTKGRKLNHFTSGLKIYSNQIPLRFDSYSGCSNSCLYCGIAGSIISTPSGITPIEDLKIGNEILSMNIVKHEIEKSRIINVMNRQASDIFSIITYNQTIKGITGEHPVYTQRGWVNVNELVEGDYILVE